jgi:hypothetical protein
VVDLVPEHLLGVAQLHDLALALLPQLLLPFVQLLVLISLLTLEDAHFIEFLVLLLLLSQQTSSLVHPHLCPEGLEIPLQSLQFLLQRQSLPDLLL